jgi:phage head maturation protease
MVSIKRGDVSQSSFAFSVDDEGWDYPRGEMPIRTIKRATLYDVSPVTYPAYADTSVSARSVEAAKAEMPPESPAEVEDALLNVKQSRERCRLADAATR